VGAQFGGGEHRLELLFPALPHQFGGDGPAAGGRVEGIEQFWGDLGRRGGGARRKGPGGRDGAGDLAQNVTQEILASGPAPARGRLAAFDTLCLIIAGERNHMSEQPSTTVQIVVESCFGNTLSVAQAVARGIDAATAAGTARLLAAGDAAPVIPEGTALLLVGSPTHALGVPTAKSRAQAAKQAVAPTATQPEPTGVREWIAAAEARGDLSVITFDTTTGSRWAGSAAKAAAKLLAGRGWKRAERGPSFTVSGMGGPLADGELDRARAWGRDLAARLGRE
jgi:hypothetical protein